MCATQLNPLVHSGVVSQYAILRVSEFIVNTLGSGVKICILLDCETAGPNPGEKIGSPVDIAKVPGGMPPGPQVGGGRGTAQPMYGGGAGSSAGGGGIGGANPYGRGSPGGGQGNPYGAGGSDNMNTNRFGGGSSSAPIVRTSGTGQPITPISGLNMYSNRWTIRAKVTTKSQIRTWSNAKGEGSLFSVELLDASGVDVRCTFFKEGVDKFYGFLEEGRVYTFSGGRLKVANMQYNSCKSQFEITFDQNSEIHLDDVTGPGNDIREHYDFVKIDRLESVEPNAYVDILAVVKHVGETNSIVSKKSGKELIKCELTVEDDSGAEVRLTMWGDAAQAAQGKFGGMPVVAFKRAKVSDYGGRTLSGAGYEVNPNIPQAQSLRQWWIANGNGRTTAARSLSTTMGGNRGPDPFDQRKYVSAIKSEQMGYNDKPDWLSFKATITFLKKEKQGDEGAWYTACANADDPCKNMYKATQTSDGNWHCDKCMKTYETCVRRFIFSGTVADDTCTSWVSVFNEQAEVLLDGARANDLYAAVANGDGKDLYDSTFMKATYTDWIIKCKVKQELVGDEQRVKTSMVSLSPVDYVAESRNLLKALCV
jgi:replication factor A1